MTLATKEFACEVLALMARKDLHPAISQTDLESGEALCALPINGHFGSYLLRPDGTVILHDPPSGAQFFTDEQSLLLAIVHASIRYPSLAKFIPKRPEEAPGCVFCDGAGCISGDGSCPACAGLGWRLVGA